MYFIILWVDIGVETVPDFVRSSFVDSRRVFRDEEGWPNQNIPYATYYEFLSYKLRVV